MSLQLAESTLSTVISLICNWAIYIYSEYNYVMYLVSLKIGGTKHISKCCNNLSSLTTTTTTTTATTSTTTPCINMLSPSGYYCSNLQHLTSHTFQYIIKTAHTFHLLKHVIFKKCVKVSRGTYSVMVKIIELQWHNCDCHRLFFVLTFKTYNWNNVSKIKLVIDLGCREIQQYKLNMSHHD